MKPLIELINISYKLQGKQILNNINLKINKGEKVALIGKSGAGKSTLISILNGSKKQTYGETKIYGKDFKDLKNYQRTSIGTIWQDLRLIDNLSAEQNVNCGLLGKKNLLFSLENLLNIASFSKAHKCMALCKLDNTIYSKNINKISGGQKQRVAISRSIIQEPDILFADEPFNNLENAICTYLKDLFISGKNNFNIKFPDTFLCSIHKIDLLDSFSRIIGLKDGEIFFDIKKEQFKNSYFKSIYLD